MAPDPSTQDFLMGMLVGGIITAAIGAAVVYFGWPWLVRWMAGAAAKEVIKMAGGE